MEQFVLGGEPQFMFDTALTAYQASAAEPHVDPCHLAASSSCQAITASRQCTADALDECLCRLQRLLAHRVSQFYGLETSTVEEGEKQGRILAKRTPLTKLPVVRGRHSLLKGS